MMNLSKTTDSGVIIKTLILTGLAFLIISTHTMLRLMNDVMVIVEMGAQAIPALKMQLILPKIVIFALFVILYRQDRIKTFFYTAGALFFGFFLFMAVLKPLYPGQTNYSHMIITLHYWMCNLWPLVMYSMLFWVAANQSFTTKQAAISYPIIIAASSLASMLTTSVFVRVTDYGPYGAVLLFIAFIIAITHMLFKNYSSQDEVASEKSIAFGEKAIYVGLVIAIFVSADLVKNGLGLMHKETSRSAYSDPASYTNFMEVFTYLKAYFSLSVTLLTGWMVWAFGWRVSVLIAPVIILLLMGMIWHSAASPEIYEPLIQSFSGFEVASAQAMLLSLSVIVLSGLTLLVTTTSQMSLIPLPGSTKARANAFLALIVGGQTISGLITTLNMVALNATQLTPVLKYQVVIALLVWIVAAILLGKRYKALEDAQAA